ncbi:hypothetical protein J0S82_003815 [Galemys pyrenaicus]|uniref:Uncharacterized protein n=1 Tax=Galemys pyrenaicus TaxID=202257 RepID=A0A8J6A9F7_GALPY|nr:hypothetical protein J0S82_003815 [Galemys pyrenaicus]
MSSSKQLALLFLKHVKENDQKKRKSKRKVLGKTEVLACLSQGSISENSGKEPELLEPIPWELMA